MKKRQPLGYNQLITMGGLAKLRFAIGRHAGSFARSHRGNRSLGVCSTLPSSLEWSQRKRSTAGLHIRGHCWTRARCRECASGRGRFRARGLGGPASCLLSYPSSVLCSDGASCAELLPGLVPSLQKRCGSNIWCGFTASAHATLAATRLASVRGILAVT